MPWVVFEGVDGSGKTTLLHGLAAYLHGTRRTVVLTSEPTGSDVGREAKRLVDSGALAQALSRFEKDRSEHLALLRPLLGSQDMWVLMDRYDYSTAAYQVADDWRGYLVRSRERFPSPDVAFVLDLSWDRAMQRVESRGLGEMRHEARRALRKVSDTYRIMARERDDMVLLRATSAPQELVRDVLKALQERGFLGAG